MTNNETDQKIIKGILIKASGHIEDIEFNPRDPDVQEFEQLQKFVGGYFEPLPVPHESETTVYVNENGRINGSAINMPATLWLNHTGRFTDYVCGDVAVFGYTEGGEMVDVPWQVKGEIPNFRNEDDLVWRVVNIEEYSKGT